MQAQLDPSNLGDTAVLNLAALPDGMLQASLMLSQSPVEDLQDYVMGHPVQDAVFIALAVFTTNALKAGASLPVAIVAACLELLRRIPGWSTLGSKPLLKLGISVAIDFIGVASYFLPLIGEVGDFAWAPASAILIKALYGSNVLSSMGFVEELVPGTDLLPTATIGWALEYVPGLSQLGWVSGIAKGK